MKFVCKVFSLADGISVFTPAHNLHSGVAAVPERLDQQLCACAVAKHVNSIAEDRKPNDPLVNPSPENKEDGEDGHAKSKDVMSHVQIGEDVNDAGKEETEGGQDEEQAEVSLPALGNALRRMAPTVRLREVFPASQ